MAPVIIRPAAGGFSTLPAVRWLPSPASGLAPCRARAGDQLGWSRPAWQPLQTIPAGVRSVSVHSRQPSQAAVDRVPDVLEFLQGLGFEGEKAVQIMNKGQLAESRLSTLEERVDALKSLPFSGKELTLLISRAPGAVLHYNPDTIRASVSNLQDLFGLTPSQVKGTLLKAPNSMGLVDSLRVAVEYLLDLGLDQAQVGQIFLRHPRALLYLRGNTEELEALQELGFSKQELAAAIVRYPPMLSNNAARKYCQLVEAMEEEYGADADTCRRLVLASPQHVTLKTATVVEKVDYLVKVMGREVQELLQFAKYVTYSLEGRIRPRYEACVKNGMENLSLSAMLVPGDATFYERMQKRKERLIKAKPTSGSLTLKAS